MKFTNYLEQITGVSIYPLISLILFVLFFALVIAIVFGTSKESIKEMEELPLDKNN